MITRLFVVFGMVCMILGLIRDYSIWFYAICILLIGVICALTECTEVILRRLDQINSSIANRQSAIEKGGR